MATINVSDPINLILLLMLAVVLIFFSKELKRGLVLQLTLGMYLALLVVHAVQLGTIGTAPADVIYVIYRCIIFDLLFILMTFMSFLWVNEMEAKAKKQKSIDNSLNWLWKKI